MLRINSNLSNHGDLGLTPVMMLNQDTVVRIIHTVPTAPDIRRSASWNRANRGKKGSRWKINQKKNMYSEDPYGGDWYISTTKTNLNWQRSCSYVPFWLLRIIEWTLIITMYRFNNGDLVQQASRNMGPWPMPTKKQLSANTDLMKFHN